MDDSAGLVARRLALGILRRVDTEEAFADLLLGAHLPQLNPADRGLVTQLVLGTLAWRGRYDYELAQLSSRPLSAIEPPLLNLLRMGLHQLRTMTRVPPHAVLDTCVRLARELRDARAGGFVNAILRAATRTTRALPDRNRNEIEYLSVAYSHPRWLVEQFHAWFGGDQIEARLAANNEPAPNAIRLNLLRRDVGDLLDALARDGMRIAARGQYPETLILDGAPVFDGECYRAGLFTPQAEASQLISRLLAPARGALVVDCAAAPGGKSSHLAALVGPAGRVIALDRRLAGLKQARSLAGRLGHQNLYFVRCDSSATLPLPNCCAPFVLLDAPCSGLGTLREHPEIRWRLKPSDLNRMSRLQSAMLEQAAKLVSHGGALVYSVCSSAPAEGSSVVRRFLTTNAHFSADPTPLDSKICREGFFATRLTRRAV